ncbi:MAG: nitrilase-related carbon-nitrogen hydrolase, partial [Solirubrobacterales bacterium]
MGDSYPTVRAAAVQAASAFLDREASTVRAAELIREAGANGARIVGFPEGFIPAHPIWFHFHPGTGPVATRLSVELFKNSVEIPGPEIRSYRPPRPTPAPTPWSACARSSRTR